MSAIDFDNPKTVFLLRNLSKPRCDMTDEEFAEGIKISLDNAKYDLSNQLVDLVKQRFEDCVAFNQESLVKIIDESNVLNRLVREHLEKWTATEIGNRFRCGIYDGFRMDKLFDSLWNEEFDKAIKDRIRIKVYAAIDAVIADKLKAMKTL